jgi:hypothetical protein
MLLIGMKTRHELNSFVHHCIIFLNFNFNCMTLRLALSVR